MIFFPTSLFLYLLYIPPLIVFAQTIPTYQTSFPFVTSCDLTQYYDTTTFQCLLCPTNARRKADDPTQCDCISDNYYYVVNQGGGSLVCSACDTNFVRTLDGFGCTALGSAGSCNSTTTNNVISQATIEGNLYTSTPSSSSSAQPRIGSDLCVPCADGTWPRPDGQRCAPCNSVTPRTASSTANMQCCTASTTKDGICLNDIPPRTLTFNTQNRFNNPQTSTFFTRHYEAAFYLCLMNLSPTTAQSNTRVLLSNATACQLLGNIAAMQLYYEGVGYAYYNYQNEIWDPAQVTWQVSSSRPSIPFLGYPTTFYTEITSASYDWIPVTFYQNDLITLKVAKYSPRGQYLGLFDTLDTHIQLCGGGYTHGRAAFTFGAQYIRSCNIRAQALWSSPFYETAFFDPYIVFSRSGVQHMLPMPIAIKNYQTASGSSVNQNPEELAWVYHRRFFLVDRTSGIVENELRNVRYVKSMQIVTTLTDGLAYIRPPLIIIEYDELSSSQLSSGTIVQTSFQTTYRMTLDTHIRDIWIAVGVLSALGIFLAFLRTTVWQSRTTKIAIELVTIFKFIAYLCNIIATVFFIVMAGVSLWWLIFFKRQDAIYLVLPTTFQQASFTALVCVAFGLKTFDILHMIGRQSTADIFFIDWEKPKSGDIKNVSVWRTYFVANEFHEIQTFRRINPTFQLFFVLFLLKVINLENIATAQPGVNLFPSSSDYVPEYNGILRVGIAFSMWLATALVQYLIYILFYRRFVEDRLLNFVDLCSVSNISVLVLTDQLYGYYIHGLSPHGTTDVNMRDMLMNLEREAQHMSGSRGLRAGSDEQMFIVKLSPAFRAQYDIFLQSYQIQMNRPAPQRNDQHDSDVLMTSYRNLNDFLCAFINHSLPTYNYTIQDRFFFEKLLNYEFQAVNRPGALGSTDSVFFVDQQRGFSNALFSGHENSLFIWNMATFLFIDYFAFNYVLAAIITYLLNLIANKLRLSFGRRNLSNKTLIPKEFLI